LLVSIFRQYLESRPNCRQNRLRCAALILSCCDCSCLKVLLGQLNPSFGQTFSTYFFASYRRIINCLPQVSQVEVGSIEALLLHRPWKKPSIENLETVHYLTPPCPFFHTGHRSPPFRTAGVSRRFTLPASPARLSLWGSFDSTRLPKDCLPFLLVACTGSLCVVCLLLLLRLCFMKVCWTVFPFREPHFPI
jgi:hypothetical protein